MSKKEERLNNSTGIPDSDHESVQSIRDKLVNAILVWIAVLGVPILFISLLRYFKVGGLLTLEMHFGVYLFWVSIAIYRKKIPLRTKALLVIGCSFIIAVTSILQWGIVGSGVAYLIFVSILVTIFYGATPGIFCTVLNLMMMVMAAILFNAGIMQLSFDPNDFSSALPSWISTSFVYGCFTLILVGCLGRLHNSMAVSIKNLTSRTLELHQAKEQMEEEIRIRNQADIALRESEERFRTVLENLPCCVSVHDLEGRHLIVNEETCMVKGYSREELMNLTVMETAGPALGTHFDVKGLWKKIELGASFSFETQSQRKDGSLYDSEVRLTKIMLEGQAVILSLIFDITERKKAEEVLRKSEEKLARSQKMESLGLLAGSVAHDLNNVLSGIVSYPELLLMDLPKSSKLRKPIETIQESGYKAVAIVQDLLTIARGVAIIKEPVNLNDVIIEYMSSPEFANLRNYHPAVNFKTALSDTIFRLSGSPIHIKKVIMNLVSNASEAIENYGNVTVSTCNRYVDTPLSKYEDVKAGEYVVLTVSDDGPGIAPENMDRIFEPFFTKKVMGISGTGLGLTVVWNTVQDHSGYIDVKSDKSGTKFELYFPITREEFTSKVASVSLDQVKGNGEFILVVDDVKSQREISCRMLDSLGYRHAAVSGGEEAIEYLKNNKVDLVLLDMIMTPGMSGRETYERIVRICPGQKAVIISGYSETEDVVAIQKLGAGGYVRKPFNLESLGRAIKVELKKAAPINP
jgi:two-component system, cell cycle sensor histidine kinase and response regulator CckA